MIRMFCTSAALFTFCAAQADLDSAAREIVHNELKFSNTSVVKGRNTAFLEFLSDSCITFNPLPAMAKEIFRRPQEQNAYLTWKPVCVEISASGDFGYSTGPWQIREKSLGNDPVLYGHYFSVWEKGIDGWKVIFDSGIGYDKKQFLTEELLLVQPVADRKTVRNKQQTPSLQDAENLFAATAGTQSLKKAYAAFAADNIRLYRDKTFPPKGKSKAMELISKEKKNQTYHPVGTKVSSAHDLGYTYGIAISPEKDTSVYLRVWRLEQEWKIAADIFGSIN